MSGSVSILIIGYSKIAIKRIIPALQLSSKCSNIEVASISKFNQIIKIGKITRLYKCYKDAIENTSADFVYISLPNFLHDEYAILAAYKGLNIIIDKPAILSSKTLEKLSKIRNDFNLFIAESVFFDSHPMLNYATHVAGGADAIRYISAQFNIPKLNVSDYRNSLNFGGGVLFDMSAYIMGIGRSIWQINPTSINISSHNYSTEGLLISICLEVKYGLDNTMHGYFAFDGIYRNRAILFGSEGTVTIDRIFSAPPNFDSSLVLDTREFSRNISVGQFDSFLIFFEILINDFTNNINSDYWFQKFCNSFYDLQLLYFAINRKKI